ncbi:MAG: hypothetical protein QOD62_896, partial [Actinomycetota bacterium]|nr:hypothetical protein [Actinomycetota bacterium]
GVDGAAAGVVGAGRVGAGGALVVGALVVGAGAGLAGGAAVVATVAVGDAATVGLTACAEGLRVGVVVAACLWLQAPARRPSPTRRHSPRLSLGAIMKYRDVTRLPCNTC